MSKRSGLKGGIAGADLFESLEARALLAFSPTSSEQYMLELLNNMRANPLANLHLMTSSLGNPARSNNADIDGALRQFNVSGTVLSQQWAALTPAPPLAWSEALYTSAGLHTQRMIDADMQEHVLPGELDLGPRIMAAGYTNLSIGGENIYAFAESVFHGHAGFAIDWGDGSGEPAENGIQNPPGHRDNMMDDRFREVGIRILSENNSSTAVGPLVITQDFASHFSFGDPWLLGVVYSDNNNDHMYSPGEGLGGVTVRAVGAAGSYMVTSMDAGGYQLKIPSGVYDVTVSGEGFGSAATYRNVIVGSDNVKLDPIRGQAPPTPNIVLVGNAVAIGSGDTTPSTADWTDFGLVNLAQTLSRTFTIRNTGTAPLQLSGSPKIKLVGGGDNSFALVQDATSLILPGGQTTFVVRFEPASTSNSAVTITLNSDDPDTPKYTFKIRGRGLDAPDIDVLGSTGQAILDGDSTPTYAEGSAFSNVNVTGRNKVRMFTIANHGSNTLTLTSIAGSFVRITGLNASEFVVISQPAAAIAPGQSTTFRIRFDPSAAGVRTATVQIASNDPDERTYDFVARGMGVLAPIVQLLGLGVNISGTGLPSDANGTYFGSMAAAAGAVVRTFTIKNIGSASLVLDPTRRLRVQLGTGSAASYRISVQPTVPALLPGQTITFRVRFDPDSLGDKPMRIIVSTANAGNFAFSILGTGI